MQEEFSFGSVPLGTRIENGRVPPSEARPLPLWMLTPDAEMAMPPSTACEVHM
jgi:hypothetical protein